MNYAGKIAADPLGSQLKGCVNVKSVSHDGHSHTITIPDAHLLFAGDFKRSGLDLILSKNDQQLVVEQYFKGEKRASLASPDGAYLTGDIVNALTGHVQYAQAAGVADAAKVIGHVTKLTGSATAIRNGVSIVLNVGDNVHKGDVVQSGSGSQLGITFIDGTVFGLSSNARMVLNEMVYEAGGTANSTLLSLVQGTISFVAGATAKNGDMKIDTPVAVLGIRGTAVLVEIGFEVPVTDPNSPSASIPVKFQVLQEPDGTVGSYVLYARNDLTFSNPIATINRAGEVISYSPNGNLSVAQVTQIAPEAKAIIDQTLQAYFPTYTPAPDNAAPRSTAPSGPSGSTPADPVPQQPPPQQQQQNLQELPTNTPTTVPINYTPPTTDPTATPQPTRTVEVTITRLNTPPEFTVTPAVNVVFPVADVSSVQPSVSIPDQVTRTDPDADDVFVPFVPGSGQVLFANGPAYTPAGSDLRPLIHLDQQTGLVTYNSSDFAFLKADDEVLVTIGFASRSGPDTVAETLTLTIVGVNDAPSITAAILNISQGGTVLVTASNVGVVDFDNTDHTFTVTNVTVGDRFQVLEATPDGVWVDATSYTTADLNAGRVRFVHGGSSIAPTFSIQADDGSASRNLSNAFVGVVNFVPIAGAILGDEFDNTLTGTPGNDVFEGFQGNDTLQGDTGRDKALYSDATAGITVNLADGTVAGTAAGDMASIGADTLQSIEYIVGSNFDDTFDATDFSDTSDNAGSVPTKGRFSGSITNFFEGGGGDDDITGNQGTMIAYDHASAAVTVDLVAGTAHGTADGDAAQVGNDSFSGVTGVRGSAFNDSLSGNDDPNGIDVFYGGAGNDLIDGRAGYDLAIYEPLIDNTVTGGITVNMALGTVAGNASVGNDTLRSVEALRGTDFNDNYSAAGFSGISANAGSLGTYNQFEGMGGNDAITGNTNTTVEYSNALAGVTVDIATGNAHGTAAGDAAGIGVDNFSGVNGIRGSEYADFLSGSNNAGGTTETFTGIGGDDFIDGRGGFDRAIYSSNFVDRGAGGITVNMALGTVVGNDALSIAAVGSDTLRAIEGIRATNFDDVYNAVGFDGSSLNAGSFGTFNEIEGMNGDDTIIGNNNTKVAFYNAFAGVYVNLADAVAKDRADYLAGTSLDIARVGIDSIAGANGVGGSNFADSITGNGAANILVGGGGDDIIDGGAGTDIAVFSGSRANYTIEFPSAGQVRVTDSVSGRDGVDTLSDVEALRFADGSVLVGSGSSGSPVNLAALTQGIGLNAITTLTGNANDFVLVNASMNNLPIDLGDGTGDTVSFSAAGFYSLDLTNVEFVTGSSGDDSLNLVKNANDLVVDLGAGTNNSLNLARGSNTLIALNVQNINGTDFTGAASNDVVTLLNNVNGVSINLAQGLNTLNLSAGNNTLANVSGVQTINGSAFNDSLTLANAFAVTVNLGDGVDTLTLTSGSGFFPTVNLLGVENLAGSADSNYVTVLNNVTGLNVDLGFGNDTLMLANGSNSVSVTNVETVSASDFALGPASDDTLTLLNNVSGVSVDLAGGNNTLDLHAGANSLASVFNVQSINGSASSDTLTLAQVNNATGTRVALGFGADTLNLGATSNGVTYVYADNGGADVIAGFNHGIGSLIDISGVSSIHSFADVQAIASQSGDHTIITFGGGNSLTLRDFSVGNLTAADFVFSNAPNQPPVITGGGTFAATEDTPLTISTLAISDADAGIEPISVTLSVHHGMLAFSNANGLTGDLDGSDGTISLTGSQSAINAALANGVVYTPESNYSGLSQLTVVVNDQGNNGSGGAQSATQQSNINIAAVTDAPFFGGDTTGNVSEDGVLTDASGNVIGFDPEAETATGTLTVQDGDSGESHFQAVLPSALQRDYGDFTFDAGSGHWTYTLDHDRANGLAGGEVRYDTLTVKSTDGTTQDITVTVRGSSDGLTITDANSATNTVAENVATGTIVGLTAQATDADAGTTISYSLTDNAGGRFAINATTGVVTVANGSLLDYETATSHNITVLATSSDGSTNSQVFAIGVTNVNDNPVVGPTDTDANANTVVENAATEPWLASRRWRPTRMPAPPSATH